MDFPSDTTSVLLKQPDTKLNNLKQQLVERDQEISRLKEQLEQARQEIDTRSKDKMALLGNMNHEIRTPMNGIIGMAALLSESNLDQKQQRYTKVILESSRSLFQVLSNTMDLAELENGRASVCVERFDLQEMINKALNHIAPQAATKDVELLFAIAANAPSTLKTDEVKLIKLLSALLSDAIKLTQGSYVLLSVKVSNKQGNWGALRFEISHCGSELAQNYMNNLLSAKVITNQENDYGQHGIGTSLAISRNLIRLFGGELGGSIDEHKNCACWFEIPVQSMEGRVSLVNHAGHCAFFQVGGDKYLEYQLQSLNGTVEEMHSLDDLFDCYLKRESEFNKFIINTDGMSEAHFKTLSDHLTTISLDPKRWIVIRNKEDVILDALNSPGLNQWSEITKPYSQFKLKIAVVGEPEKMEESTLADKTITTRELTKAHILLVEDNQVNQMVAKALLIKLGYRVTVANDGIEAIECYLDSRFDLVLMDIRMPRMDGVEATHELKKMMSQQKIPVPVIALTANATLGAKDKYVKLGLDDYLAKPVQAPQLHKILQKWLNKPPQPNSAMQHE